MSSSVRATNFSDGRDGVRPRESKTLLFSARCRYQRRANVSDHTECCGVPEELRLNLPRGSAMSTRGAGGTVNAARLEALLDKLVAVQLDLEPTCKVHGERSPASAQSNTIAEACKILHSAMADLRNVIQEIDGSPAR